MLAKTKVPVKWLCAERQEHIIAPAVAVALARSGVYEGKARKGRVYYIREIDNRPQPLLDETYWEGRPIYPGKSPSPSRHTVDVWDKFFSARRSRSSASAI